mmetsp:Transcript_76793/g.106656  ORF Transcript_76793/g.106656 Transcript_76793/m.106656 type:complete len:122 (+) Transcript_76793:2-367(+)
MDLQRHNPRVDHQRGDAVSKMQGSDLEVPSCESEEVGMCYEMNLSLQSVQVLVGEHQVLGVHPVEVAVQIRKGILLPMELLPGARPSSALALVHMPVAPLLATPVLAKTMRKSPKRWIVAS